MSEFANGAAWIDGRIVPVADAKIPVNDWGLTHSDATYDVAPVWDGAFFRLDDYLTRFEASCAALRLDIGMERPVLRDILHAMVAASGLKQAYVAMVATRGMPLIPGVRDPLQCQNRFFAWCVPYIHVIKPDVAARGASIHIAEQVRRIPEDSVNSRIKNYHWGDFTAGMIEAKDKGFETVLLLDHQDNVTEGPGFNVFAIKGERIITPWHHCLHGITRKTVLEISQKLGLKVEERALAKAEFLEADEILISTSGGGPVWIANVAGRVFSNGAEGVTTAKIKEAYWRWMAERTDYRDPIRY